MNCSDSVIFEKQPLLHATFQFNERISQLFLRIASTSQNFVATSKNLLLKCNQIAIVKNELFRMVH